MQHLLCLSKSCLIHCHLHGGNGLVQVLSNDGVGEFRMSQEVQEHVLAAVTAMGSDQALRCLALAYKSTSTSTAKAGL